MRFLTVLVVLVAVGESLTLPSCGGQSTTAICFGPRPVSAVHPAGNSVRFSMTTRRGTVTYSVAKTAFGGAPAKMKIGDVVAFCAETVDTGGRSTTTITQFSDQGQSAATETP
jgi:hypothetical protein